MWQPPSQRQKKFFFVFANCHAKAVDCRVINLSILFFTYYCVLKTRLHKWNNMLHGAHWLHPTNWHGPPTCTPTSMGQSVFNTANRTRKSVAQADRLQSLFSPKRIIVITVIYAQDENNNVIFVWIKGGRSISSPPRDLKKNNVDRVKFSSDSGSYATRESTALNFCPAYSVTVGEIPNNLSRD